MATTKRRRSKGEGGISEYRKGHYRAFLDLGKDPKTGKRVRKTFTGKTKQEVIEKLNKAKYEKQEGLLTITEKTPLRLFAEHWLELKKTTVKETSHLSYENTLRVHILPNIGDCPINEITPLQLNLLFNKLKLSATSKKTIRSILSNVFKIAVKEGLLTSNPVTLMESFNPRQKEIRPITHEEIKKLLEYAKYRPPFYHIIKLALETGMRRGEIFGLHWSDIDFKEQTISVRRILTVAGTHQFITTPKTARSSRIISVSPTLLSELSEIRKEGCDIVFSNHNNDYMKLYNVQQHFKGIVDDAGLRHDIRFHDLRHTNATMLIAAGVNMKTVSTRLGHSSITITLDRYAHAVKEEDRKAAEIMNNNLV